MFKNKELANQLGYSSNLIDQYENFKKQIGNNEDTFDLDILYFFKNILWSNNFELIAKIISEYGMKSRLVQWTNTLNKINKPNKINKNKPLVNKKRKSYKRKTIDIDELLESCKKETLKYKTRSLFAKNSPRLYNLARINNLLNKLYPPLPKKAKKPVIMKNDSIFSVCSKTANICKSEAGFSKKNNKLYIIAKKNNWLPLFFPKEYE